MTLLARLLTLPRWLLLATAATTAITTHTAAYHLGAAFAFRAGFDNGAATTLNRLAAQAARRTANQIEDRLNAETASHPHNGERPDGLRCGPSARDCPE